MVNKTNKLRTTIGSELVQRTARRSWKEFLDFITEPPHSIAKELLSNDKKLVQLSTLMDMAQKVGVRIPVTAADLETEDRWQVPDRAAVERQRLHEQRNATTTARTGRRPSNSAKRDIEAKILAAEAKLLIVKGELTNNEDLLQEAKDTYSKSNPSRDFLTIHSEVHQLMAEEENWRATLNPANSPDPEKEASMSATGRLEAEHRQLLCDLDHKNREYERNRKRRKRGVAEMQTHDQAPPDLRMSAAQRWRMGIDEERRRNNVFLRNRRYVESGTSLITDEAHSDQSADNSPEESGGEEAPIAAALSVTAEPEQEASTSDKLPALDDEDEWLSDALLGPG